MNRLRTLALITSLIAFNAVALDSQTSAVNAVRTLSSGTLVITLKGNNNGCGGNAIVVNKAEVKPTATSIALTAITSGKKIKAKYIVCSNSPWANTATSSDITLYD